MGYGFICCTFKINRSCGCTESVYYSGKRSGSIMDSFIKKESKLKCQVCDLIDSQQKGVESCI